MWLQEGSSQTGDCHPLSGSVCVGANGMTDRRADHCHPPAGCVHGCTNAGECQNWAITDNPECVLSPKCGLEGALALGRRRCCVLRAHATWLGTPLDASRKPTSVQYGFDTVLKMSG